MKTKTVEVKNYNIKLSNDSKIVLIAGPCVIANEKETLQAASTLKKIASKHGIPLIFKASYDKANRSSINSYRGPGIDRGLEILLKVKSKYKLPIITDVHCKEEVKKASKVADILQIPAFLCRQTDLLVECAKTRLPVNVKKGQFLAPEDTLNIINKFSKYKNSKVTLTERGTSFGYRNLIVDMKGIEIMRGYGQPIIFDATHSVQQPGGLGKTTGGNREFVEPLSKAAISLGIAGIFFEVHKNPAKALSDGPNSLTFVQLDKILSKLTAIDNLVKKRW